MDGFYADEALLDHTLQGLACGRIGPLRLGGTGVVQFAGAEPAGTPKMAQKLQFIIAGAYHCTFHVTRM